MTSATKRSTVVSHLAVFLVLVLAVRDVGISAREVTWPQVLKVFAVVRLLSALPITPGGLGIVDLGYIGGLVLAGRAPGIRGARPDETRGGLTAPRRVLLLTLAREARLPLYWRCGRGRGGLVNRRRSLARLRAGLRRRAR